MNLLKRAMYPGRLALIVALLGAGCVQTSPPEDELARRIAASHPVWESYQEDIKGQIGAGPVAEWQGKLVAVSVEMPIATVRFRLDAPWASRKVAIPVLLRDPMSGVYPPESSYSEGDEAVYTFRLPPSPTPPPWVEVKYPHEERRVVLSPAGTWTKTND